MNKTFFLVAAALSAVLVPVQANVTFAVRKAGLQNGSGVATNGMSYGFLVDTDNNGFQLDSYLSWDISTNGQFLSTSSGSTMDWFVYGGTQGSSQTPPTTVNGAPFLGDGSVGDISGISFTNLTQNNEFVVIWFPEGNANTGSIYGAAGDGGVNMKVPSDGSINQAPASISPLSAGFTVAAVPEPSTYAAIFGVAMLLYVGQRRRK